MARSLFKLRKTSCCLMDLRSAMSLGSNKDCSTASTTYPAVPRWKSRMEASLRRGAPSSFIRGAQAGPTTRWSPLFSPSLANLICVTLGCLTPLWGLISWGGWVFPTFTTFFPFSSLFLLWSAGSALIGWVGGGVGSLVWGAFPSASLSS